MQIGTLLAEIHNKNTHFIYIVAAGPHNIEEMSTHNTHKFDNIG